jgi:branched-chain amino acid transport system substrate-binding protein
MRKRRLVFLLVLLSCALLFLVSCQSKKTETQPRVYKIGTILSLSGPGSPLGLPEKNAIEMAVEEINNSGGVNGNKIEVIIEDDQTDPAKAAQGARKLIERDKVIAIIGSSVSPCSLAIKEVVKEAGIPWMCPSAANVITASDAKWVFRTAPKDAVAVEMLLNYLKEMTGIKKIAILHDSNAFGQSGADEIRRRAGEFGLEVVAAEKYETNAPDLSSEILKLKKSNPDALVVWGTNPGPAIAAKSMKQLGFNVPYFGSHGIANKKFIELAGEAAEGIIFPAGKILVAEQLDDNDPVKPLMLDFIKKYEQKFKEKPVTFTAHAYDALMLLKEALKVAGSTDPEKIRKALEGIRDFKGLDGTISYSETDHDGIGIDDMVIVKIENGNWVRVY